MTTASQSRQLCIRNYLTWSLVFGFWFLILARQGQSQNIPVIGGYSWVYDGTAPDTNYSYHNAMFRSLTHIPSQGVLVAGVHTSRRSSGKQLGAILTLDERTGAVLRLDSICPRVVRTESIRSAWLNDSGTVMCYTCDYDRPRLVSYPSMIEIKDTVLQMTDSKGNWFWTEGRISSTGRYLILYTGGSAGWYWIWLYDRVTGELFNLQQKGFLDTSSDGAHDVRPQFSADDRLLVTYDVYADGKHTFAGYNVWDVERRRVIDGSYAVNERYHYMLSHTGDKLLITTKPSQSTDRPSYAMVYDAWTMKTEWYLPFENPGNRFPIDHRAALSYDGTEVVLERAIQTDTGFRIGYYWYTLPDTTPRGFVASTYGTNWLQPKTPGFGIIGGVRIQPAQCFWNDALSVHSTSEEPKQPLYPNPTSGEVVIKVGECQSESWQMRLSDQAGALVKETIVVCNAGEVRTTLQALPAGQYYLLLREPMSDRVVQAVVVLHR